MKIKIAGIENDSIVDGPGIRLTVFTQGCPHNCDGCHNESTHDPDGGYEAEIKDILLMFDENKLLSGLTLSGGEPFEQARQCAYLAAEIKLRGKNVITYTGYTFEFLFEKAKNDEEVLDLLKHTDLLIDGPFIKELKSLSLDFRGSRNQRIIDMEPSLTAGKAIICSKFK